MSTKTNGPKPTFAFPFVRTPTGFVLDNRGFEVGCDETVALAHAYASQSARIAELEAVVRHVAAASTDPESIARGWASVSYDMVATARALLSKKEG